MFSSQVNTITWQPDPTPDVVYYEVYRAPAQAGPWQKVATTALTSAVDDVLATVGRGVFWYQVASVDLTGLQGGGAAISSANVHITQTVGPEGGTIAPTSGTVILEIPPPRGN